MDFQIGDVVMFMGHGYIVIDFDEDVNLLILTDGISTTSMAMNGYLWKNC